MKSFIVFLFAAWLLLNGLNLFGKVYARQLKQDNITVDSFLVSGNCEMCKKNIESAAKLKGVKSAVWNIKTHQLVVKYKADKIQPDNIQSAIAEAGYDTEKFKTSEANYKKLPKCCKYDCK